MRSLVGSGRAVRVTASLFLLGFYWFSPLGMVPAQTTSPAQIDNELLSPFGIGADHHTSQYPAKWIPQMAAIGIHVIRSCHANWDYVEPKEGTWTWTDFDSQMNCIESNQLKPGVLLYGNPSWNTKDKPGSLPVNNLPAWSAYASEMVRHCKGKVKYYEVWNEPPNGTFRNQTPADYAKIVVAAYEAAKAVDPSCSVGLAAKSVHLNYLQQVIQAGAKDHFDWITLHPYEVLDGVAENKGTESIYMHIVPTTRKMLATIDPAKVNVPIIFTEIGNDASKDADRQGQALVKAYTMGIAEGVACIDWFEGIDGDSGAMGLLKADGTPRPSYRAMEQMIHHLGQHPSYLGWVLLNNKDYGFLFRGTDDVVLITWAPKGSQDSIHFDQTVSIADPLTGTVTQANVYTLTTAPIIVDHAPAALALQARANKARPFPWGGDYTHATSVSITLGATTIEKGLHTQAGDAVAADVLAYGGSARAGSVPGGNVFMIDPNFLSYAPTPIKITAVVRRDAANDNAGFKLVYEAATPSGFKVAGDWYTVPDNKEWHTVSWTINDAQFVNYWGYNFSLDSNGRELNKYDIQSVTVTKLDK